MKKQLTKEALAYMMFLVLVIETAANKKTGKETINLRCVEGIKEMGVRKRNVAVYVSLRNKLVHNQLDYQSIYGILSANSIVIEDIASVCAEYVGVTVGGPNYPHEAVYGLKRELKELI